MDHLMSSLSDMIGVPGLNNVAYGLVLIAVVWLRPDGVWPPLVKFFEVAGGSSRAPVVQAKEVKP
jgi:branched-chain amino acid transport system permease protein